MSIWSLKEDPIFGVQNIKFINQIFYPLFNLHQIHFKCLFLKSVSHLVVPNSATHGLQPTRLFCPWDFPGKDTGMVCHFLLQGIFLTQGSNLGLLHCRQALYQLSYQGSP